MDNPAKMRVGKLIVAVVFSLTLISVGVGVAVGRLAQSDVRPDLRLDEELPPIHRHTETILPSIQASTPPIRVPLLDCINGSVFTIDDSIRVYTCKDEYVDIRKWGKVSTTTGIRYSKKQWHKLTLMTSIIETYMGIFRLDDGLWISLNKTETIDLREENGGITLTLNQWFELRGLTDKINNVLGLKANSQGYIDIKDSKK